MALTSSKNTYPPPHIQRCLKFLRMHRGGMLAEEIAREEGYKPATVRRMISTAYHWLGYEEKG